MSLVILLVYARHSKTQYVNNPFANFNCKGGSGGGFNQIFPPYGRNDQCNYPLEECYTNESGKNLRKIKFGLKIFH